MDWFLLLNIISHPFIFCSIVCVVFVIYITMKKDNEEKELI